MFAHPSPAVSAPNRKRNRFALLVVPALVTGLVSFGSAAAIAVPTDAPPSETHSAAGPLRPSDTADMQQRWTGWSRTAPPARSSTATTTARSRAAERPR